jgi:hypothetical protein
MPNYWHDIERRWTASMDAARDNDVDNSAQIHRLRDRRIVLPRSYAPIAITGIRGAGKSVVYDAITGRVNDSAPYPFRGHDEDIDISRAKTGEHHKRRSKVFIIPGQLPAAEQEQAFNQMFRYGHKPRGIIHVVSWGYDWIWGDSNRRAWCEFQEATNKKVDLAQLLLENRREELAYFRIICDELNSAWAKRPPGVWLIIAVTKCDLFWSQIDDAKDYYLPDGKSDKARPFRSRLSKLVSSLHEGGLSQLAVLPVSSVRTPFDFSESTSFEFKSEIAVKPSENINSEALINKLQKTIGDFNAKR